MNLITIVGARPQFVKAAPVSAALAATGAIRERLLHTGQHFDDDMSAIFFRELGVAPPAWNLGIDDGRATNPNPRERRFARSPASAFAP